MIPRPTRCTRPDPRFPYTTLFRSDLHWRRSEDGLAELTVRADAFCHNMVRALTGCLIAIGDGRRPVSWATDIMEALRRDPSLTVMQAHGLTLERSEEHTSELQSLMRISYAVFCLKKKKTKEK